MRGLLCTVQVRLVVVFEQDEAIDCMTGGSSGDLDRVCTRRKVLANYLVRVVGARLPRPAADNAHEHLDPLVLPDRELAVDRGSGHAQPRVIVLFGVGAGHDS
jgi:hypothetical protein